MKAIAITAGEPAGIGPDLCVQLAQRRWQIPLVVIADADLLRQRAEQLQLPLMLHHFTPDQQPSSLPAGHLWVVHLPLKQPTQAGQLNVNNAPYVLASLETAVNGIEKGYFSAMVTGPVHKGVINEAGIAFTGHTEWLAERAGNLAVVMMLACSKLRVALATTHLPVKSVSAAISQVSLQTTLSILYRSLRHDFGIDQPRILLAGLNPHAGEGGHLGREEIDVITPVSRWAQAQGWAVTDPLPADTLFTPPYLAHADAVLSMFHDQGLPVLKHLCFGEAVNITLGLPFIRTSVDHGTALDLAGTGKAEVGSFVAAIDMAALMVNARLKQKDITT
jgi:4-hydroxythreonine-4-phosphate dehydrogenase